MCANMLVLQSQEFKQSVSLLSLSRYAKLLGMSIIPLSECIVCSWTPNRSLYPGVGKFPLSVSKLTKARLQRAESVGFLRVSFFPERRKPPSSKSYVYNLEVAGIAQW